MDRVTIWPPVATAAKSHFTKGSTKTRCATAARTMPWVIDRIETRVRLVDLRDSMGCPPKHPLRIIALDVNVRVNRRNGHMVNGVVVEFEDIREVKKLHRALGRAIRDWPRSKNDKWY